MVIFLGLIRAFNFDTSYFFPAVKERHLRRETTI